MTPANLWALLWGDAGQFHEVQVGHATCWIPCSQKRPFTRLMDADDVRVSAVPRYRHDAWALAPAHVLWTRLESPACAGLLARLPTPPTLVVRESGSSRRTALWALSEPLTGQWIKQANERLSHACKGRRGSADPSALIVSPFSRVTLGRTRPSKAYVEYESGAYATARQIVGRLPDAPDTDGWRAAA
jgi:hypothetical protein